jgi:hypothetical protein
MPSITNTRTVTSAISSHGSTTSSSSYPSFIAQPSSLSSLLNECWIAILLWSKIVLCASFECNVAWHVDTTTSAHGTYKISQESAEDVPEDQMNVTKGLSEAPDQSSKDNDANISDFSPTSKGKPRT